MRVTEAVQVKDLKPLEGKALKFAFRDGYEAVVRLIDVSEDDPGRELIYDVLEVLHWGAVDPARVDLKAAHCAGLNELVSATELPARL